MISAHSTGYCSCPPPAPNPPLTKLAPYSSKLTRTDPQLQAKHTLQHNEYANIMHISLVHHQYDSQHYLPSFLNGLNLPVGQPVQLKYLLCTTHEAHIGQHFLTLFRNHMQWNITVESTPLGHNIGLLYASCSAFLPMSTLVFLL
eukprot:935795-Ditylum_brightwellii.AAC.1